jgi:hypothetical protein
MSISYTNLTSVERRHKLELRNKHENQDGAHFESQSGIKKGAAVEPKKTYLVLVMASYFVGVVWWKEFNAPSAKYVRRR